VLFLLLLPVAAYAKNNSLEGTLHDSLAASDAKDKELQEALAQLVSSLCQTPHHELAPKCRRGCLPAPSAWPCLLCTSHYTRLEHCMAARSGIC
jgi:hypothetical protein